MTLASDQDNGTPPPGYTDNKPDHLARLHKVEGQVRGITRMVGADRYCVDVLTQISAATHALQEVALALLDDHMRHCVTNAARSDPPACEEKLAELAVALRRTLRL
ncbi:metal-sensitive transcriptional regulator [Actinacidiphila glaucinigra]|uniref:metal-sensitive transcriptional regulator n=1 Tax=Actinacidiphila glaucinigra TaxID=235986 RepID=UPI0036E71FFF